MYVCKINKTKDIFRLDLSLNMFLIDSLINILR